MKKIHLFLSMFFFMLCNINAQVDLVITEIMYNPPESGTDSTEFIEIYNNGSTTVDLTNYTFTSGIVYTFPTASIPAGGYVVVATDSLAMVHAFGYTGAYQWTAGGLSNGGEPIALKDNAGNLIDSLRYDDVSPWPSDADGDGYSIVFCDPNLDNTLGSNWSLSGNNTGNIVNAKPLYASPGQADSACITCTSTAATIADTACITYTSPSGNYNWMASGTYMDTIPNMAGCDSVITINLVINNPSMSTINDTACASYTSPSGNYNWMTSGTYMDTIPNMAGCDSVITINLVINTIDTSVSFLLGGTQARANEAGAGVTYQWIDCNNGNAPISGATSQSFSPSINGSYAVIITKNGCTDTSACALVNANPNTPANLIFTEIMYNPPESGTDSTEFIEIYNNGSTTVDLTNYAFTRGISYTFPTASIPAGGYVVVAVDSLAMVHAFGYTGAYQWTAGGLSNGGESIVLTDNFGNVVDSVRYDDGGAWPSDADGDGYSIVFCDTSLDRNLGSSWALSGNNTGNIVNAKPLYASPGQADSACICTPTAATIADTACVTYTSPSGNYNWMTSGTYMDTISNVAGCDSVITINLVINNPSMSTINDTACASYTSPSGNYNWMTSGTYMDTIPNMAGCDSIITINLVINNPSMSTINDTACVSYTSPSGNHNWMTSGTYMDTIPNMAGCDSIITINLVINNPSMSTIADTACASYTSPSGNYNWMTSGTYMDTISNMAGCDSIITINLVIDTIDTSLSFLLGGAQLLANEAGTGVTYQWINCDSANAPISGATNQGFTPIIGGHYAVILTKNGCTDTSACVLASPMAVSNTLLEQGITVYPNPSSGIVNIDLGTTLQATIEVFNAQGQLVYQATNINQSNHQFELNQAAGLYIITINTDKHKAYFQLIKE